MLNSKVLFTGFWIVISIMVLVVSYDHLRVLILDSTAVDFAAVPTVLLRIFETIVVTSLAIYSVKRLKGDIGRFESEGVCPECRAPMRMWVTASLYAPAKYFGKLDLLVNKGIHNSDINVNWSSVKCICPKCKYKM